MYRYAVLLLLIFIHYAAAAQSQEGVVLDMYSKLPIAGLTISNDYTGNTVITDKNGWYSIQATMGDTLVFSHIAYRRWQEVMSFSRSIKYKTVLMVPLVHALKETIITGHTKYQQDSIERRTTFAHDLDKTIVPKPKYTGLGCSGCIGWLADKITNNSKIPKRFIKEFAADDQSMFIDSRYTISLVTSLTGIADTDSVAAFVFTYPMAYDFARAATDLEMKVWIRENYKNYTQVVAAKKKEKGEY